jgi:hypothetical protein
VADDWVPSSCSLPTVSGGDGAVVDIVVLAAQTEVLDALGARVEAVTA